MRSKPCVIPRDDGDERIDLPLGLVRGVWAAAWGESPHTDDWRTRASLAKELTESGYPTLTIGEPPVGDAAERASSRLQRLGQAIAWQCGTCHQLYNDHGVAERCCAETCPKCNQPWEPRERGITWLCCPTCRDAANGRYHIETFQGRFARASRVALSDYEEGQVYWEVESVSRHGLSAMGPDDGYFSIDGLYEFCEEEEISPPSWVWACRRIPFSFGDPEDMADDAMCQLCDGLSDPDSLDRPDQAAIQDLREILDGWYQRHTADLAVFSTDYSRIVILDQPKFDKEQQP